MCGLSSSTGNESNQMNQASNANVTTPVFTRHFIRVKLAHFRHTGCQNWAKWNVLGKNCLNVLWELCLGGSACLCEYVLLSCDVCMMTDDDNDRTRVTRIYIFYTRLICECKILIQHTFFVRFHVDKWIKNFTLHLTVHFEQIQNVWLFCDWTILWFYIAYIYI